MTGDQAELLGFMTVLDPPMVGHPTRVRMSGAAIKLPNPNCDGQFLTINDPVASWSIVGRPAGGTGTLTQVSRSETRLVADKPGEWVIGYTACPNTCRLANVLIPPLSGTVTLRAVTVVEGRLNDNDLRNALIPLLHDSRIQISQTDNGTPLPGNTVTYMVEWRVPAYKYGQLCEEPPNAPPTWRPAPICDQWDNGVPQGQHTFHSFTPIYNSYIDFGPNAVAAAHRTFCRCRSPT